MVWRSEKIEFPTNFILNIYAMINEGIVLDLISMILKL